MAQFFSVHPDNPQTRLLKQAVQMLNQGQVLAVPTDSSYALVCHVDDKAAVVSPRFHRRHHSIGIGHESQRQGRMVLGGCNFGVLLPWWDMLFGTADFQLRYDPTGVRDQVEQGRDYGQGFWAQQWRGCLRLLGRA